MRLMTVTSLANDVTMLFFAAQGPSAFQPPLGTVVTVQHDLFQEVMARLLFTLVTWVRQIPAFLVLPQSDQVRICPFVIQSLMLCLP